MHPRTAELLHYLDEQSARLRNAFEAVPRERWADRPAPDRWSPAEVVHHVAIVHRRLTPRVAELVEKARALPPEREMSPLVPNSPAAARGADRGTRRVAAEAVIPRDTDVERVWDDFEAAHHALKGLVASADGLALGAVTAPHPALGELNAYEWAIFAGAHVGRHAEQIREMSR